MHSVMRRVRNRRSLCGLLVVFAGYLAAAQSQSDRDFMSLDVAMALHGAVRLELRIAPNGSVRHVECVGGHLVLADAATKAVVGWKYNPAAAESMQTIQFKF